MAAADWWRKLLKMQSDVTKYLHKIAIGFTVVGALKCCKGTYKNKENIQPFVALIFLPVFRL